MSEKKDDGMPKGTMDELVLAGSAVVRQGLRFATLFLCGIAGEIEAKIAKLAEEERSSR